MRAPSRRSPRGQRALLRRRRVPRKSAIVPLSMSRPPRPLRRVRPEEDAGERRVAAVTTPTTAAPRASSQPIDPAPSTLVRADRDIHSGRVSSPATSTVTSGGEAVSARREVASSSVQATPRSEPISAPAPAVAADPAPSASAPRSAEPQFVASKATQRPAESSSVSPRTHDDASIERSIVTSAPSAVDHAPPSDAPARAASPAPAPVRHDVAETAPLVAPKTSHRTETSDTHAPTAPAVDSADARQCADTFVSSVFRSADRREAHGCRRRSSPHPRATRHAARTIGRSLQRIRISSRRSRRIAEEMSETQAPTAQSVVAAKPEHAPTPSNSSVLCSADRREKHGCGADRHNIRQRRRA